MSTTVKVTNLQIKEMHDALQLIDNAKPKTPDHRTLVFPGKVIYALAKNARKLRTAVEDIEEARVALVSKHLEEQKKDIEFKDVPQLVEKGQHGQAFIKEYTESVLEQSVDLELLKIKVSDLDLNKNNSFPFSVLADLEPMLEDDGGVEKEPAK